MATQDEKDYLKMEELSLPARLRDPSWSIRKKSIEQLLFSIEEMQSPQDCFSINKEVFSLPKLVPLLDNLIDEKHPQILLRGLECVECILKKCPSLQRQFIRLVDSGLQKFPLLTQQRKAILEKFLEILELVQIDSALLKNKLSLPQEKSVLFVMEVIGAMRMANLTEKLIDMSKNHSKICVRELAAQIAQELQELSSFEQKQETMEVKSAVAKVKSAVAKGKPMQMSQVKSNLVEKLQHYEQLNGKDQQKFSSELVENIEQICQMGTNLSPYVRLMAEDNNLIISTNGIKILSYLVASNSSLLLTSFPLLFIFQKFKTHKTHPINATLFSLVDVILNSNRSQDVLSAIVEGMALQSNKANLKYGCVMSYIRAVCLIYHDPQLFQEYCIGEYTPIHNLENRRTVEKYILKGCELLSQEKQYGDVAERVKERINYKKPESTMVRTRLTETAPINSRYNSSLTMKKSSSKIVSPEPELKRILELIKAKRTGELQKAIEKCLGLFQQCIREQKYELFYFCELLQSFVEAYLQGHPNEERTIEIVSLFMVDCLKHISVIEVSEQRRKSRVSQSGLELFFSLAACKLALSSELVKIMNSIGAAYDYSIIFAALKNVFEKESPMKKNRKNLVKWLEANTPESYVNQDYYALIDKIQTEKIKKTQEAEVEKIDIPRKEVVHMKNQWMGSTKKETVGKELIVPEYNYSHQRKKSHESNQWIKGEAVAAKTRSQFEEMDSKADKPFFLKFRQDQIKAPLLPPKIHTPKEEYSLPANKIEDFGSIEQQISHIEQAEQAELEDNDRMDEKWEEILSRNMGKHHETNKFEVDRNQQKIEEIQDMEQTENKQAEAQVQLKYFHEQELKRESPLKQPELPLKQYKLPLKQPSPSTKFQAKYESKVLIFEPEQERGFEYQLINRDKLNFMLSETANPYAHLRSMILIPYKSHSNKGAFIREFICFINERELLKPQPFNSVLLLVILLFSQIRQDKSLIGPLQTLYESMIKMCSTNEFIRTILGLFHTVIEETPQPARKFILTILAKSVTRFMPFVESSVELLSDIQNFYQIGEMVYFDMYEMEYEQIKKALQDEDSLGQVVMKSIDEDVRIGDRVEQWLLTRFKEKVQEQLIYQE